MRPQSMACAFIAQFDFGTTRSDIQSVRITARDDCCLDRCQNLDVYLSPTTTFSGSNGVQCVTGLRFAALGETTTIGCPLGTAARYLTVMRVGSGQLNLQEVTPLYTPISAGEICTVPALIIGCNKNWWGLQWKQNFSCAVVHALKVGCTKLLAHRAPPNMPFSTIGAVCTWHMHRNPYAQLL